ncbi:MAG: hypothetical protein KatS3mg115_0518 [Candidatus Poribacteria bacterium]|nr:MAG: hypothetical protein KatS3mg115_0518 [Candidatus Poribacteria bacterium]
MGRPIAPRGGVPSGRFRFCKRGVLLFFLGWLIGGAWAYPRPEGVVDPLWPERIEFLATRAPGAVPFLGLRPAELDEPRGWRAVQRLDPFSRALWRSLQAARPAETFGFSARGAQKLQWDSEGDLPPLPQVHLAALLRLKGGWSLFQEFRVLPVEGLYPPAPGGLTADRRVRPWDPNGVLPGAGYAADFLRAGLSYSTDSIGWKLGRFSVAWGPGWTGGLLLSDASPSLDGVLVEVRLPRVRGQMLFSVLNRLWHDEGGRRYLARRYFAAHRIDWQITPRLELGIMDSILYGGDLRGVEWEYLNPLLPFYAAQYNNSTPTDPNFRDDNAAIGFDLRWAFRPGWAVYGELFVDDFRYSSKSNDPHALAWLIGFHHAGWRERGEVRVEYVRVGRYVYTHLVPENQYSHYGMPLGHPLANDADRLLIVLAWWLDPSFRIEWGFHQTRKGESTLQDRFRGEEDSDFLAGAAETRRGGFWRLIVQRRSLSGRITAYLEDVRQPDHEPGSGGVELRLSAEIGLLIP